jgi:hypothetical protein
LTNFTKQRNRISGAFNNDLISPEAVMKLRQKHPGTVRIADEDMGEIVQDSPLKVGPRASALWISSHLPKMCREAFSSEHELFNILGGNLQKVDATSQKDEGYEDLQRCFSSPSSQDNIGGTPCIWHFFFEWCQIRHFLSIAI